MIVIYAIRQIPLQMITEITQLLQGEVSECSLTQQYCIVFLTQKVTLIPYFLRFIYKTYTHDASILTKRILDKTNTYEAYTHEA
jgi:hypothetical protein